MAVCLACGLLAGHETYPELRSPGLARVMGKDRKSCSTRTCDEDLIPVQQESPGLSLSQLYGLCTLPRQLQHAAEAPWILGDTEGSRVTCMALRGGAHPGGWCPGTPGHRWGPGSHRGLDAAPSPSHKGPDVQDAESWQGCGQDPHPARRDQHAHLTGSSLQPLCWTKDHRAQGRWDRPQWRGHPTPGGAV